MCGIVGVWTGRSGERQHLARSVTAMAAKVFHRGPDSRGIWTDEEAGIGLGHRRLSIVDLSDAGAQPMQSASGRYVITYNGELFRHQELRAALQGEGAARYLRGHSDTEILLEAIDHWGLLKTLERIEGQFAFGLWDKENRVLSLARDRFGEKPLYYCFTKKRISFASSMQSLKQVETLPRADVDVESVRWLCEASYIPDPRSIFRSVAKIPAGSCMIISERALNTGQIPQPIQYWNARDVALRAKGRPFPGSDADAEQEIERLLSDSVAYRLQADVPVGILLSGGVDSTCIAALAQSQRSSPIKTFTIGFAKTDFDEAPYALRAARDIGTDHTTLHLEGSSVLNLASALPDVYDEPFADSSQIAMLALSRLVRDQVVVGLGGDGGDELFGGYSRHSAGVDLWEALSPVPLPLRLGAAGVLGWLSSTGMLDGAYRLASLRGQAANRWRKAINVIGARSSREYYERLIGHTERIDDLFLASSRPLILSSVDDPSVSGLDFSRRMMIEDTQRYLGNDILTKVDRASMSTGLEIRSPFLDGALFEFAWSLPTAMLIRNGRGKLPLRRIAERYAPSIASVRPKHGFAVPLAEWLRGPLREWAGDLLSSASIARGGIFSPMTIDALWTSHRSAKQDHSARLWPVLMFAAWHDRWFSSWAE